MRTTALASLSLVLLTATSALAQPALRSRFVTPNPFSARLPPPVETLVPEDAPAVVLINTSDQLWNQFRQFEVFPAQVSLPQALTTAMGLVLESDIRSWMSNRIAIALMPTTGQSAATIAPHPILVMPFTDDRRLWQFLDKAERVYGTKSSQRWYKQATIVEWDPNQLPSLPETDQPGPGEASMGKPNQGDAPQPLLLPPHLVQSLTDRWSSRLLHSLVPYSPRLAQQDDAEPAAPLPMAKPRLAFAVFDDYVIAAESAAVLEEYIDRQPAMRSLMASSQFQRTLADDRYKESLLTGYGNMGQLILLINASNQRAQATDPENQPFPMPQLSDEMIEQLQNSPTTVDAFLWTERNGIRLRYTVHNDTLVAGLPTVAIPSSPNRLLARIPGSSYVSLNSIDLASTWKLLLAGVSAQPELQTRLDEWRQQSQATIGLDDRDIFAWMDGEMALCLFPTQLGLGIMGSSVGAALMVQTSDRPAAEAALKKLDDYAKYSTPILVTSHRLHKQVTTNWQTPDTRTSLLSHGWLTNDTLLLSTSVKSLGALMAEPGLSLPDTATFQTAIATFPTKNLGYSYVNVGALMHLGVNILLPQMLGPDTTASILQHPEALALRRGMSGVNSVSTSTSYSANGGQVDVFLSLKPAYDR